MHSDPISRKTNGWGRRGPEALGVFDPLLTPAPTTVAQVQHLRLTCTVGDECGDPAAVDIGDPRLASLGRALNANDHPGTGREVGQSDAVFTSLAGLQRAVDVSDIGGVDIGDSTVGRRAQDSLFHLVGQGGHQCAGPFAHP